MSTKTTFKRIALATVAALGFGLMSAAPSSAAAGELFLSSQIAVIDVTKPTTAAAGSPAAFTIKSSTGAVVTQDGTVKDSWLIRAAITSAPAGGISQFTGATTVATIIRAGQGAGLASGAGQLGASLTGTGATVANTLYTLGTMTFSPAVAGTYAISFYHDANNDGILGNGEMYQTTSLTVGTTASGLTELGNAATTTASDGTNLNGMIVPSVGATIDEVSGRVAQMVGFAPHYFIKRNAGNAAASANTNTAKANLNYTVTNPAGTAVSVVTAKVAGVASTEQNIAGDAGALQNSSTTTTTTSTTSTKGSVVYFATATAGTYTITVWHDADGNDLVSAGEASATQNVVIAADALPSITFTKFGANVSNDESDDGDRGQLVKVSLRNGTNPWQLASNESLVLTSAASTTDFLRYATFSKNVASWNDVASGVSTLTMTAANFNASGDSWFNIGDTTDAGGTFSVSAIVTGGTANGASGSFTITTINTDAATAADLTDYALVNGNAVTAADANRYLGTYSSTNDASLAQSESGDWFVKPGVAQTVTAKVNAGTGTYKYYTAKIVDTLGLITGVVGAEYIVNTLTPIASTGLTAASTASLSLAIPATTAALATGTTVAQMVIDADTDITINIKVQTAVVDSLSTDPADLAGDYSLRAAAASTNKFTAYVWDQFGNAVAGAAVTAAVTGRNATAVSTTLLSDATGAVSFSVADTYTGTLLNSDSLVFTSNSQTSTVTINYAAYNPASTVAITGGASADVAPAVTYSLINAGTKGASGTLVKMTATVKDANGATLPAGIPVTWAISGLTGTSAIYVDPLTGYDWSTSMTDSNGAAITYVYAWGTGTVSVTATAGTVTSATAGKINFANAAADARVVSATVKDNIVTAKVVDRYGNAVKGVSLTATRNSGVGYFSGAASSSAVGTTNALGTVDFVLAGGAANVTVATTTLNDGQTSSAAAAVNGTAITATSIGASLSPAGVQSVTVDVTSDAPSNIAATAAAEAASDAAAEAIDAANAATDAANLAAEAADAATVAAEEARDAADAATAAVEELATQVATLMAALKAQITTLANTVAKIAKKVKA